MDSVEGELATAGKREVASYALGDMALMRLRTLNEVAYVRFASVYKAFQSIEDFIEELNQLKAAAK
jgi:transcriptional repressor NrdR